MNNWTVTSLSLFQHTGFTAFWYNKTYRFATDEPITLDGALIDVGANLNVTSGAFTCPSTGTYLFFVATQCQAESSTFSRIVMSQHPNQTVVVGSGLVQTQTGHMMVAECNEGERVWLTVFDYSDNTYQGSPDSKTSTFSGFKLRKKLLAYHT